jgi:hypothetical protein
MPGRLPERNPGTLTFRQTLDRDIPDRLPVTTHYAMLFFPEKHMDALA